MVSEFPTSTFLDRRWAFDIKKVSSRQYQVSRREKNSSPYFVLRLPAAGRYLVHCTFPYFDIKKVSSQFKKQEPSGKRLDSLRCDTRFVWFPNFPLRHSQIGVGHSRFKMYPAYYSRQVESNEYEDLQSKKYHIPSLLQAGKMLQKYQLSKTTNPYFVHCTFSIRHSSIGIRCSTFIQMPSFVPRISTQSLLH